MPPQVVVGPPFAGKSQLVAKLRRPGQLLIDTTVLAKALYSPDSKAVRTMAQARVAQAAKMAALKKATELGEDGWVLVAERDPIKLKKWLDAAGQTKAWLVTEPMETLIRRARKAGPECEELLIGWEDYEDDPEFMSLTEPWSDEAMRMIDIETQYREAQAVTSVREAGTDVQHRCLTDDAELRAEGAGSRVVSGIAVRYGDEARLSGFRERIARGALKLPERKANLTIQHDRAQPLGLLEWQDDDDALRFRSTLTEGPRQDQMLMDVSAKLVRGASIEFKPTKEKLIENDETEGPLFEILEAQVIRLSLVDDGAYPQSAIRLRVEPMAAAVARRPRQLSLVNDGPPPPPRQPGAPGLPVAPARPRLRPRHALVI